MKRSILLLSMLGCLFSLSACAFMGAEDREFYGTGWVNPKELDKQADRNVPMRPEPPQSAASNTLPTDATPASSNGGWQDTGRSVETR